MTNAPSVSAAVARNGRILWEEGFGWANREERIAADRDTPYSLASVSKPFTATALMALVQKRQIHLGRPIDQYLGTAKLRARVGDAADATVRRVANHTSGLPQHHQFFYADEPYRPPAMEETIRRYANLVTIPGEQYEYSNLGYGLLGYIVARVSNRSYEDFLHDAVFAKLGLNHSAVGIPRGFEKLTAMRYGRDGAPLPFYDFDHPGASAIYASAHDLVRFGMFHLKARLPGRSRILTDASIDEMQKPTAAIAPESGYGIGWRIDDRPDGYREVSHTGHMDGAATLLRLVPSEQMAVAVLCNANLDLPYRVAEKIFALLLPGWESDADSVTEFRGTQRAHLPDELRGVWTGRLATYKGDIRLAVRVQDSGGVEAQLGMQPKTAMTGTRWDAGTFHADMPGDIGTEDTNRRRPNFLQFHLKLRGGTVLNGPATAISGPGRRQGNALTQWVELRK